jgi:hypothetical protein
MQERTKDGKLVPSSPWDREEQEKQVKLKEEENIRTRNEEIAFLESKSLTHDKIIFGNLHLTLDLMDTRVNLHKVSLA